MRYYYTENINAIIQDMAITNNAPCITLKIIVPAGDSYLVSFGSLHSITFIFLVLSFITTSIYFLLFTHI